MQFVTPSCLKAMYNVGDYKPSIDSGSRLGFSSFLNQSAQYSDQALYQRQFNITAQNFTKIFVNDAPNDQDPWSGNFGEANLDAQLQSGVGSPLPITEYLTGGSPPFVPDLEMTDASKNTNEPYLPYYQYLLSQPNSALPQVISTSYGEPEQTVPRYYAQRVCTMIAMLGLRGITLLESSGDIGVGSYCLSNDGLDRPVFLPIFPATCPYITAIGGTEGLSPVIGWRDSSGGFSEYFKPAWYQAKALQEVCTVLGAGS